MARLADAGELVDYHNELFAEYEKQLGTYTSLLERIESTSDPRLLPSLIESANALATEINNRISDIELLREEYNSMRSG